MLSWLMGGGRDPADDFWYRDVPHVHPTASGAFVSPETAMRVSAVYSCIKVISESVAALPVKLYRRLPTGDKQELPNHPLYDVLHDQPNDRQTAYQFWLVQAMFLAAKGNALAEMVPGSRGAITQLVPHDPDNAHPVVADDGSVSWRITERGTRNVQRVVSGEDMWHIPGTPYLSDDGVKALSPLDVERQAVGDAIATRDYGARFFANDATPGGVIQHPSHFKNSEDREAFRQAWQRAQGGNNRGKVAVLEWGMEFKPVTVTNEQAQFLETRKYQDVDIARIYRVPPHKIGILDRATFSNIEQQAIEFVVDTLRPWLVCLEQAIKKDLLIAPDVFAEFKVDALLRGDIESRYRAYAIGRNWGWLSANDVRRRENMNRIQDGDEYLRPGNMMPADEPPPQQNPRSPNNA